MNLQYEVVEATTGVRLNSEYGGLTSEYGDAYAVNLHLIEDVGEGIGTWDGGIEVRYQTETVSIKKTGDPEADRQAIREALVASIAASRERNRGMLTGWLESQNG